MATSQRSAVAAVGILGMLVLTCGAITGCGDDTSGGGGSGTSGTGGTSGSDAGLDATSDGSVPDTGMRDTGALADQTVTDTGAGDTGVDTGALVDTGVDTGAPDTGARDAGDAGDAGVDTGIVDAGPDVDTGVVSCNSASVLGDASGTLVFAFSDGVATGWQSVVQFGQGLSDGGGDSGIAPTVTGALNQGNTCAGALALSTTFTDYNQQVAAVYNYGVTQPWNATSVHFALKVVVAGDADASATPYQGLANVQAFINGHTGDGGADTDFLGINLSPSTFANGAWQSVSFPIPASDAGGGPTIEVDQIGVSLLSLTAQSDAGTSFLRSAVTVYVDDIWYE